MTALHFTTRARATLQVVGEEAAALGHEYIGTEHLLLAVLHDSGCAATNALTRMGISVEPLTSAITSAVKIGNAVMPAAAQRPCTSRAKMALELAMIAAREDAHAPVSTQHLLLGLVREEMGIAAQMLTHAGVTVARLNSALGEGAIVQES